MKKRTLFFNFSNGSIDTIDSEGYAQAEVVSLLLNKPLLKIKEYEDDEGDNVAKEIINRITTFEELVKEVIELKYSVKLPDLPAEEKSSVISEDDIINSVMGSIFSGISNKSKSIADA